jgi:hypothetical protein
MKLMKKRMREVTVVMKVTLINASFHFLADENHSLAGMPPHKLSVRDVFVLSHDVCDFV